MKISSQFAAITTFNVRFIAVQLSETINLPAHAKQASPVFRNREADERGFQRCVTGVTPGRVINSFEMADPRQRKQNSGVRSRAWSLLNILPGTASARAFYAEVKSHPKLGYLSRNRSQSRSKFCRFCIHATDTEPKLESQHFAPDQNRGRQYILLRAGALVAADSSPDSRIGV